MKIFITYITDNCFWFWLWIWKLIIIEDLKIFISLFRFFKKLQTPYFIIFFPFPTLLFLFIFYRELFSSIHRKSIECFFKINTIPIFFSIILVLKVIIIFFYLYLYFNLILLNKLSLHLFLLFIFIMAISKNSWITSLFSSFGVKHLDIWSLLRFALSFSLIFKSLLD